VVRGCKIEKQSVRIARDSIIKSDFSKVTWKSNEDFHSPFIDSFLVRPVTVLHIGTKVYPFEAALQSSELSGQRGGGMSKYVSTLIRALPDSIRTVMLVQKFDGQPALEHEGAVVTYRYPAFGNRSVRQIIANTLSFLHGFILVRRHEVDVVHGHMQIGILFAWLLGRLTGRPVVATPYSVVTASEGSGLYTGTLARIEKFVYPRVDALVFESPENRTVAIEQRGFDRLDNDHVILTGISVPERASLPDPDQGAQLRLFYIGRIVPVKALDCLVEGVALLPSELRARIHLDIIGEGEMSDLLASLVARHGLEGCVDLHGFVEDTSRFYEDCDVFVLPSHQEGLSVSLLEAMSHGKACLINDFGVPFQDGDVIIMPDNAPETIAATLRRLLASPQAIREAGALARKRIEEEFSVASFARRYESMYLGQAASN